MALMLMSIIMVMFFVVLVLWDYFFSRELVWIFSLIYTDCHTHFFRLFDFIWPLTKFDNKQNYKLILWSVWLLNVVFLFVKLEKDISLAKDQIVLIKLFKLLFSSFTTTNNKPIIAISKVTILDLFSFFFFDKITQTIITRLV